MLVSGKSLKVRNNLQGYLDSFCRVYRLLVSLVCGEFCFVEGFSNDPFLSVPSVQETLASL